MSDNLEKKWVTQVTMECGEVGFQKYACWKWEFICHQTVPIGCSKVIIGYSLEYARGSKGLHPKLEELNDYLHHWAENEPSTTVLAMTFTELLTHIAHLLRSVTLSIS